MRQYAYQVTPYNIVLSRHHATGSFKSAHCHTWTLPISQKLGLSYVPLSYFPGIPFPDGRFPGNPGKPGKYKFVAVYINNWQQTPTFLTFCIQTQWEREKYCKTSTRAMLQYPVPSTSTLYNPVCSTQAKLARNRDKLFLIKQSLLAHAFRSFQCSF